MKIQINQKEEDILRSVCWSIFKNSPFNWRENLDFLFLKFYNPKTRQKAIFLNIQSLEDSNINVLNILRSLEKKGLVEFLYESKYVIPKPLGVLVNFKGDNLHDEDILSLIQYYHSAASSKLRSVIKKFGTKKILSLKEIAPLIFLLYNNNISENRGKFIKDIFLKQSIDRIVSAFVEDNADSKGTKDRDGSLSGYHLTEANNKLGLPIFIKEPMCYIKPNRIKDVEDAVRQTVKTELQIAKSSFEAFKIAFERESKFLFKCGALNTTLSSKQKVNNLFQEACKNGDPKN